MSVSQTCSQCGAEVPANAPAGLCPACLLKAGLPGQSEADASVPPTQITPPALSGFVPPTPAELQRLFPQLEILELLGKGGMGAVYKARQAGLDRLVAVKILPSEISHDPAFAERFQREARALARLSHPHIVGVYDFGQAESLYYFVMEFVDGTNLRQTIRAGTLTPAEALAIVPQICDALQFAHDEGIVHRDIKPENILIDKRGRVKIADFGLAKLLGADVGEHSLTATHQVMGTLRYMAPEQMQGSRQVDHRADIYSLGVVFYELLTGELPMGKFAPPSKRVQVDVRLDEVVLRALEQDPEQRYQHASDMKSELETISIRRSVASINSTVGSTRDSRSANWSWQIMLLTLVPAILLLGLAIRFGGPFLDSLRGFDGRVVELGGAWGLGSSTEAVQLSLVLVASGLFVLAELGCVMGLYRSSISQAERLSDAHAKAAVLVRGPAIGLMVMSLIVIVIVGISGVVLFGDEWFGAKPRTLMSWIAVGGYAFWGLTLVSIWGDSIELLRLGSRAESKDLAGRSVMPHLNLLVFLPISIWVQIILARPDVQAAFPADESVVSP
ncbi:MAG: prkC 34 [Planctomycetaceae bacterium]|nr:prkC 34 [Planctomycetaceae bacterium]